MAEAMPTHLQTLGSVIVQLKQHVGGTGCTWCIVVHACIVLGNLVLDACFGVGVPTFLQSGALC